jgi:L-ascorbate metabolism protein UlaG (beta-lactamase superfamily)
MFFKQFGGKITADLQRQYEASPQWRDGKFQNLKETEMSFPLSQVPKIMYRTFAGQSSRVPDQSLPVASFDKTAFLTPHDQVNFIWYGHSVVLLRIQGKTVLIDPMLGPNASPIAPFPTKRFSENTLDLIDDFPEIDLLLMTHDHYDHLDLASIRRLKKKTKQYFVALGVKRHLVSWGIEPDLITEFDWWDQVDFHQIGITFTPTRHFSGRGLTDRQRSLWGGWALKTTRENLWFSGDGGYGSHFSEIGKRLGPFDLGFMECGQYSEFWPLIHLFPEESVQAALDAQVKKIMPVHWAGFSLAQHHWTEPATRIIQASQRHEMPYTLPVLGQQYLVSDTQIEAWWES